MNKNNLLDCPTFLKDFLFYLETIRGLSSRTVDGYYIDLRTFLRFVKMHKLAAFQNTPFEEIPIADVDIALLKTVTLSDIYEYMYFLTSTRENNAATRARKVTSLRTFYKYLTTKANLLSENPVKDLDVPNKKKSLPKYLTLDQSIQLLEHVDSSYPERDYCILTLFLNCGMRLSELVGIDLKDFADSTVRVTGKGNKERILYLNEACMDALNAYLQVRQNISNNIKDRDALFISRNGKRIDKRRVQQIVSASLKSAGLDQMGYSTHKLRHTAATLMYQQGHVDIRVLKEILGHVNIGTTEIYTHVSNEQIKEASTRSPLAHIHKTEKTKKAED